MLDIVTAILPYIPSAALPIILVVLGGLYIYRKIGSERKSTAEERDKEFREIHDKLIEYQFQIAALKGTSEKHDTLIDDLREQITILNTNVVKLTVTMEQFMERFSEN